MFGLDDGRSLRRILYAFPLFTFSRAACLIYFLPVSSLRVAYLCWAF